MNNFVSCQFLRITSQKDAFALATSLRFNDESFVSFPINLTLKFFLILRQDESFRKKTVVIREDGLKFHEMPTKHVFLSQIVNTWNMVDSLVSFHSLQKF